MKTFKIGDVVEVLDEDIRGEITNIEGDVITLQTDSGFDLQYPYEELVKIGVEIRVTNFQAANVKRSKEPPKKKNAPTPRPKERNAPKIEVDLHIQQLVKSTKNLGNYDILNIQLDTAKRQLDFAIAKRIQKVVFIHGVGEGILKEELQYLFNRYDNLKYYDADYQKYGMGATEVYIFQNA